MQKHKPVEIGDRFERLVVVSRSDRKGTGWHFWWNCVCDCGNEKQVSDNKLKRGEVRSCGCLRRETCSRIGKANRTHGEAVHGKETPEFKAWISMISRTTNPSDPHWRNYGAKGVKVDRAWMESYTAFLADVGRRPSNLHSIDRYPNPFGNYEPGNVRWATAKEQMRNRTVNRVITIGAQSFCVAEWCELSGISSSTFHNRLRRGVTGEQLLVPPRLIRQGTPTVAAK